MIWKLAYALRRNLCLHSGIRELEPSNLLEFAVTAITRDIDSHQKITRCSHPFSSLLSHTLAYLGSPSAPYRSLKTLAICVVERRRRRFDSVSLANRYLFPADAPKLMRTKYSFTMSLR